MAVERRVWDLDACTRSPAGTQLTRRVLARIQHHFLSLCWVNFGNLEVGGGIDGC